MIYRTRRLLFLLCAAVLLGGCAGSHVLARADGLDASLAGAVAWYAPAVENDRTALARWRGSVGPPLVRAAPSAMASGGAEVTVVSWNTAVGDADVIAMVRDVARGREGQPLVLLLQEVYRRGEHVPRALADDAVFARRLGRPAGPPADVDSIAAALGMSVYYVPSMRNGGPESDEDRGNAILANVPLTRLEAIELSFENQRRVAVAAVISGTTGSGAPWQLRIVSAHLDNTVPRRLWIASEYGRARQARGLVALLDGVVPTVLGGDFNTWFGFSDQAYVETLRAFPQTPATDRRATFRGLLRLDHQFHRLPAGWTASVRRLDDRYGSDHSPLVGTIRVGRGAELPE